MASKNKAVNAGLNRIGKNIASNYRQTALTFLQIVGGRMGPTTTQFWLCLVTAANFGVDVRAIAALTGLKTAVVQRYLDQFITLGFVRNGRVVPGYMNQFTSLATGLAKAGGKHARIKIRPGVGGGNVIPLGTRAAAAA